MLAGRHSSTDLGSSLKWLDFTFYILRSAWRRVKQRLMPPWNWFSGKVTVKINESSNKKDLAAAVICCLLPIMCLGARSRLGWRARLSAAQIRWNSRAGLFKSEPESLAEGHKVWKCVECPHEVHLDGMSRWCSILEPDGTEHPAQSPSTVQSISILPFLKKAHIIWQERSPWKPIELSVVGVIMVWLCHHKPFGVFKPRNPDPSDSRPGSSSKVLQVPKIQIWSNNRNNNPPLSWRFSWGSLIQSGGENVFYLLKKWRKRSIVVNFIMFLEKLTDQSV